MHVLSMPPAFALSQDQTLRFITHHQARTARSRGRLSTRLRSPLSTHSARLLRPPSAPRRCPVAGTAPRHTRQQPASARLLASRKPMRLSEIRTPPVGPNRRRMHPASLQSTQPVPESTKDQEHPAERAPPLLEPPAPRGADAEPAKTNTPPRCGRLDIAPDDASFKPPIRSLPKGIAPRQTSEMAPLGANFKTRKVGPFGQPPSRPSR